MGSTRSSTSSGIGGGPGGLGGGAGGAAGGGPDPQPATNDSQSTTAPGSFEIAPPQANALTRRDGYFRGGCRTKSGCSHDAPTPPKERRPTPRNAEFSWGTTMARVTSYWWAQRD